MQLDVAMEWNLMNWVLMTLAMWQQPAPEVFRKWTAPFVPQAVLLRSDGSSLLFRSGEVFAYDRDGNLEQRFSLTFSPRSVFEGPDASIWIHDGDRLLGRLNDKFNLQWQRDLPPPTVTPFVYLDYLVYAGRERVSLLDPSDGSARYGLYRSKPVRPMGTYRGSIVMAGEDGTVFAWEPLLQSERLLSESRDRQPRFYAPAPTGERALVYDGGLIEVFRPDGRVRWRRDFRIDLADQPIWLRDVDEAFQLVVASHARDISAFDERGQYEARLLLRGRPKAMVQWDAHRCLTVPSLQNKLVWYDARVANFQVQTVAAYQIHVLANGGFVLLVDKDGTIRLYRRQHNAS